MKRSGTPLICRPTSGRATSACLPHHSLGAILALFLGITVLLALTAGCATSLASEPVFKPAGAAPNSSDPAAPLTYTLTLIHSNDTWGYVEPCG